MIINQNQNFIYKSRINHKPKDYVTQNNQSNTNLNITPLKRESNEISFKGVSSIKMSWVKKLFYSQTKAMPLDTSIETLEKYIGKNTRSLLSSIMKDHSSNFSQRVVITTENGKRNISFVEKRPTLLIWEGIKYPFTQLPQEIYYGTVKWMAKHKMISPEKFASIEKNSKVYNKIKDTVKFEEKFNALKGQIETANKYADYSDEAKRTQLIMDSAKMYDPKSGNYNTVHERALNRIVSGFIPAFFLANDAYNLSSLIDDDKKNAKKEHDLRFNQEIKRVTSNAYLQLITLGALSKYINKSTMTILGTSWLTFLVTEAYSRLSNGKPIHFISSEEAKRINAKNAAKSGKTQAPNTNTKDDKAQQQNHKSKEQNFKSSINTAPISNTFNKIIPLTLLPKTSLQHKSDNGTKVESDIKIAKKPTSKDKAQKPLLNADTLLKSMITLVAAGYALKFARKNKDFNKIFKAGDEFWQKYYKKITQKHHLVSKTDFDKVITKLKEGGYTPAAEHYAEVAENFQKSDAIKKILQDNSLKSIMKKMNLHREFAEIENFNKSDILKQNFDQFMTYLEKEGYLSAAKESRQILDSNKQELNADTYRKIYKVIQKSSKEKAKVFDSIFIIDESKEICKNFEKVMDSIKENKAATKAIRKRIAEELSKHKDSIYLGDIPNKIKTTVDFIVKPFQLVVQTLKFPYATVETIVNMFNRNMPKFDGEIKTLSNIMQKMPNELNLDNKVFAKRFEDNIQKSFNKTSMSGVSNADLSNIVRFSALMGTGWFLVADNYNMVMLKSNGENKEEAKTKRNERIVQEASRFFYTTLFIAWFNNTFQKAYNTSLLGMSAVTAACTVVGEYFTRKSIGIPLNKSSQKEILNQDYDNLNNKGAKGKFFRFMSRLTGKKALTERKENQKN